MKLAFTPTGWDDYVHWQTADRQILKRINRLIEDTLRDAYAGIGKPEPLKYLGGGVWSRRLTEEHRHIYRVTTDRIDFLQGRYHY